MQNALAQIGRTHSSFILRNSAGSERLCDTPRCLGILRCIAEKDRLLRLGHGQGLVSRNLVKPFDACHKLLRVSRDRRMR
jgi:hypothetical protein